MANIYKTVVCHTLNMILFQIKILNKYGRSVTDVYSSKNYYGLVQINNMYNYSRITSNTINTVVFYHEQQGGHGRNPIINLVLGIVNIHC